MSRSNQTQTLTAPSQPETKVETGALRRPHAAVGGRAGVRRNGSGSESKHAAVVDSPAQPPTDAAPITPAPDGSREQTGRDFAHVRTVVNIADPDPQRAEATRQLLELLAAQLGLRADRVEIRVDAEAERRTWQSGARGLMDGGVVYLNPKSYRPGTREGRYLLGHEVAHAAQRAKPSPARSVTPSRTAELEAHAIGEAFALNRRVEPVLVALPAYTVAADAGPRPVVEAETVKVTRAEELKRIRKLLETGFFDWAITDGDVEEILGILATMAFATAKAVVGALSPNERYDLVNNIASKHFKQYRPQVLACYAALEPAKFKRFDEDLLSGMDLGALAAEEQEAVVYTLRNLDEESRADLLDSKYADEIKKLMVSPALSDTDLEQAQKRAQRAKQQEELRKQVQIASSRLKDSKTGQVTDQKSRQILDEVTELMDAFIVTDAKALRAFGLLKGVLTDTPRFVLIAQELEARGKLDTLIDNLPTQARFAPEENTQTFLRLLSLRPNYKNVQLARSELSYGLFDYRINEDEARFAYRLIKVLPLEAQDHFRRLDDGKWYRRLESHINPELIKGGEYRGIEVREKDGLLEDAAEDFAARLGAKDAQKVLEELLELCKKGIDSKNAERVYQRIAAIGAATDKDKPDATLLGAIVRRLDGFGYIDKLFDELETTFIFAEANRATTLRIMLARDPAHAQHHARELIDSGFFDSVTPREAYLAYQIIRTLPPNEQRAFIEKDKGKAWSDILGAMTSQMRLSRDMNSYVERDGGLNRANILGQIARDEAWTEKNAPRLDGLIRMAIAMGERKAVFEISRLHWDAYKDGGADHPLKALARKYALYENPTRTEYRSSDYDFAPKGEGGGLWSWLAFIFGLSIFINRKRMGVTADLNKLQTAMGGDISGIKLAEQQQQANKPENTTAESKAGQRAQDGAKQSKEVANQITVEWDIEEALMWVRLPKLRVQAVNYHAGGLNFQSGPIQLDGLKVKAGFENSDFARSASIELDADSLLISDTLLTIQDTMVAANRISLSAVHAGLATPQLADQDAVRESKDHIAIPIIEPILRLIRFVKTVKASMKGLGTIEPIEELGLRFGALQIEGLNINGKQQIEKVQVRDFNLTVGGTRPTYLRNRIASLERRIKQRVATAKAQGTTADVAALQEKLEKDQAELKSLQPKERELTQLQRKAHLDPKNFNAQEQQKLDALQAELKGGVVLDVGEIGATGISGKVNMDDIALTDIHGEGEATAAGVDAVSALIGPGLMSDPTILRRFAANTDPKSLKAQMDDAVFRAEIGTARTSKLTVMAGIPTSKELKEQKEKLEKVKGVPERAYEYKLLSDKLAKVERYEHLAALDFSTLKPSDRDELLRLQKEFEEEVYLKAGPIALENANVTLDLSKGRIAVGGKRLSVGGLEMRQKGLAIDNIGATDFSIGVSTGKGLAGLKNLPKGLSGADIKGNFEIAGVRLSVSEAALQFELERLKEKDLATLEKGEQERVKEKIQRLEFFLDGLRDVTNRVAAAEKALGDAATDEDKARAQKDLDEMRSLLRIWQSKYSASKITLENVNAEVRGLENLLKGEGDIAGPVRVQGKDGKPIYSKMTVSGYEQRNLRTGGKEVNGEWRPESASEIVVGSATFGPTTGAIIYDGSSIQLENVGIEELALKGLSYTAPGMQVWTGDATSHVTLKKIIVNATIGFSPPQSTDAESPEPRPTTTIDVSSLQIAEVEARGLSYFDVDSDLQIDITSGTLKTIALTGFKMEMPEDAKSKITGGAFSIKEMQNIDASAAVIGSLQSRNNINASGLVIGFAEDGSKTIDLEAIRSASNLTNEDLDLGINLNAKGIHAHFSGDGKRKQFAVKEIDELGVKGTVKLGKDKSGKEQSGTVDVKLSAKKGDKNKYALDTGEIFTPDEFTTQIPNFSMPLITLSALNWDGGDMHIATPGGSPITLEGLTAGITLEKEEIPRDKSLPVSADAKPKTRLSRIVINELRVAKVTARGLTFDIKDTFSLTLPAGELGILEDVRLRGIPGRTEGFEISREKAGKGWSMLGQLAVTKFDLPKAHADIAGLMNATANLYGEDLVVGVLSTSKFMRTVADLRKLKLTELQGELKGTKFAVVSSGADKSRHGVADPAVELEGLGVALNKDKVTDKTSLEYVKADKLGVRGVKVDMTDKGVHLDISDFSLPAGFKYKPGGAINVIVPDAAISSAYVKIDNVMKLAEGGGKSPYELQNFDFLDKLNGDVNLDLVLPIEIMVKAGPFGGTIHVDEIQKVFPIRMHIENGKIQFKDLEKTTLGGTIDEILDFEVKERDGKTVLILQFDPKRAAAIAGAAGGAAGGGVAGGVVGGLGGLGAGALATSDVKTWTLDQPGEAEDATKSKPQVRLKRLIKPDISAPSSGAVTPVFRTERMEYRNVTAALSLLGQSTIDLGKGGKIHLGAPDKDGVVDLKVPTQSSSTDPGGIPLELGEANLSFENLVLGGSKVVRGAIHVEGLKTSHLTFDGPLPKEFEGTITSATAKGLEISIP